MAKVSEMAAPAALSGLELIPILQGGGSDGNKGLPLLAQHGVPTGAVLLLRVPMVADLSSTAEADPGAGKVRWDNADPDGAAHLSVDDADGDSGDVAAALTALDTGGFVYLQANGDSARRDTWQKWQVTGVTDGSGYTKLALTLQGSGGSFVDGEAIELTVQQPTPTPGVDRNVVTALASSSGVVTVDCSLGDYFTLTPTEDVTGWSFANVPAGCCVCILVPGGSGFTVAMPAATWADGSAGAFAAGSGEVDELSLLTANAGGVWHAALAGKRS